MLCCPKQMFLHQAPQCSSPRLLHIGGCRVGGVTQNTCTTAAVPLATELMLWQTFCLSSHCGC
jgi:hypothetical protein